MSPRTMLVTDRSRATPRADLLDARAKVAETGAFRLPIGEVVPLDAAIPLIAELENGGRLRGKAVVTIA